MCGYQEKLQLEIPIFLVLRSFVAQRLKIGNETRIGAGSIVLRNTKDGNLYMGNPAKKIDI